MDQIRTAIVAGAAALALVAAGCGGASSTDGTGAGTQAQAAPAAVEVMLSDFAIEPATIAVPADTPLSMAVMNHGEAPHTFGVTVDGSTIETPMIDPGGETTLELPALAAGTYEALCTVPGHTDLGMVATVEAGAEPSAPLPEAAGATGSTATTTMPAEQMASMHEQGVQDFLAGDQTSTQGGQPMKATILPDGTKRFELYTMPVSWEVAKDQFVDAMSFNEQVPGPEIRVRQGDRVEFVLENQLDEPTTLHFHGVTVPNEFDGVPFVTQDPIMPGRSWTYRFRVVDPPGFYVYHSHFNSTAQVGAGLYGALLVLPEKGTWSYPSYTTDASGHLRTGPPAQIDQEYTMFLGDGPLGYTLNGKSFPATAPLTAERGDWVLLHLANDGSMLHPMHLHGFHFEVVAQDGFPLDQPYLADTLVIAPGQRFDVLVRADYPGAWAFHCHILPHVEGPEGMFGMVTALVVS
ncbi:MAG TPA: multicopper oxidase domain-containing protein [Actinomycetota bacterium]